ncbi:MAG: hypothetical protein JWQ01_3013 [Massilia sp.]|jgi:hypothetical protein|nr:hypothetical protein [Massilia sp.]
MTFNYSRVANPQDQGKAGSRQFGALGKFLSPGMPHTGRWIKSEVDRDRLFWANIARVTPIDPRSSDGAPRDQNAYILQKDPDGCWFLDQWKENSAGHVRPISAPIADRDGSWRKSSENADTYYIIEIS